MPFKISSCLYTCLRSPPRRRSNVLVMPRAADNNCSCGYYTILQLAIWYNCTCLRLLPRQRANELAMPRAADNNRSCGYYTIFFRNRRPFAGYSEFFLQNIAPVAILCAAESMKIKQGRLRNPAQADIMNMLVCAVSDSMMHTLSLRG